MVSLEQLDPLHKWVSHEFDRMARDGFNWCVKGIGVQDLFLNREGALRIIGDNFRSETLFIRSLPDRLLYGGEGSFCIVEIKALEARPNVAVEAYQLCLMAILGKLANVNVLYLFGESDDRSNLQAWICSVRNLPVEKWYSTPRFKTWPEAERRRLLEMKDLFYPNIPSFSSDSTVGSGDPFIVFSRAKLLEVAKLVASWFIEHGVQKVTKAERIAWEGREFQGTWKKFPPPQDKYLIMER